MRTLQTISFVLALGLTLSSQETQAQTPAPIVIQAASASSTPSVPRPAAPVAPADSLSLQTAIKTLQELKAANEEILKKQEATLQRLDEVQKEAEQLKIFSKRS